MIEYTIYSYGNFHISLRVWTQQINGLVQDYSNSSALAMELLLSCTKPSK